MCFLSVHVYIGYQKIVSHSIKSIIRLSKLVSPIQFIKLDNWLSKLFGFGLKYWIRLLLIEFVHVKSYTIIFQQSFASVWNLDFSEAIDKIEKKKKNQEKKKSNFFFRIVC